MAIDVEELQRLNADYTRVTGKPVRHFVCPITLEDDPNSELCDGHILNAAIRKASRKTVIQRKDVDGYFGTTLEPELIRYLNTPCTSTQDLLCSAGEATITLPTGETDKVFFPGKKSSKSARSRFQQIDLFKPDGSAIASPFLRTAKLESQFYKGVRVELSLVFNNGSLLGGLLKSAYLAFFCSRGYAWVMSACGDKVRRALSEFYMNRIGKAGAAQHFSEFEGAFSLVLNETENAPDTMTDGACWLHFLDDDAAPILFAQSCLLRVNDRLVTMTLPETEQDLYYFHACREYERFRKDRTIAQTILCAWFIDDHFEVDLTPLSHTYVPVTKPKID